MEGSERQRIEQEWAERMSEKYDVPPNTVTHIKNNLVGIRYRGDKRLTKRQRTEEFLELYFEAVKEEQDG